MSAGNLTSVEMVQEVECPTLTWPMHRAEIYNIGRLRLLICQRCARHEGVSEYDRATRWDTEGRLRV